MMMPNSVQFRAFLSSVIALLLTCALPALAQDCRCCKTRSDGQALYDNGRYGEAKTIWLAAKELSDSDIKCKDLNALIAKAQKKIIETAAAARRKREAEEAAEQRRRDEAAAAEQRRREKQKPTFTFDYKMVRVAGGTYTMGSFATEAGRNNNECQHSVTVTTFSIGQTEVTQAQWKAVMGSSSDPSYFKGDKLPVEQVSWNDVQAFIKKLNAQTGKNFRLPTEDEWEYAAREGGKNVRFGNGKDIADSKEINFDGSKDYKQSYSVVGEYYGKTTLVGTFSANMLGLYDMSGNVWEWCSDWYNPYPSCSEPKSITYCRIVRGGGWDNAPSGCRTACRRCNAVARNNLVGFRLAQD